MDQPPFHYQPRCSKVGCGKHGVFKVASPWTYGNIRELKNYGVCCEEHRDPLFERAKAQAPLVHLSEGETVGAVGVYQILPGVRDAELTRVE
jgi:hypothetical protein